MKERGCRLFRRPPIGVAEGAATRRIGEYALAAQMHRIAHTEVLGGYVITILS
jgi:hypothetical protein